MGCDASNVGNVTGPDYFSFYKCEIAELLSQDGDSPPSSLRTPVSSDNHHGNMATAKENNTANSSSLFSDCIGPEVSETKIEKLKSLLRQSVFSLSQDVDEMVDPVLKMCELKSVLLGFSDSLLSISAVDAPGADQGNPCKKLKPSHLSSPASTSESQGSQERSDPEPFNNSCRLKRKVGREALLMNEKSNDCLSDASVGAAKEDGVDDHVFLLQSERSIVEEGLKRESDDLLAMLSHMEQELEELLDAVMSKCRLMTLLEKQQLQRMIKNLPPRNLDGVLKIIQCHRQSDTFYSNQIHIDLEKEDNITLWRLYFYVEAVENAKKLCSAR
ncbi:unnamed protein product [Cuscuta epithymum]|uniref:NET domain-containing protein n=1 Tax=Cuscuta epithymum TaxID=186058 RepID=A0AAV0D0F4_9ASTE|nr:unnamed protein product [Cuscuta epithymum]